MPTQTRTPTFEQTLNAPAKQVFEAFNNATRLCEWFCYDAQLEADPGGRFYAYWREQAFYAMGQYTEVKPGELLALTWQDKDNPQAAQVRVAFAEKDGQTTVKVEHDGPVSPTLEQIWRRGLDVLKATQEGGFHLELLERPMLGILISGNLTPENQAQFGVPVDKGVILQGTAPNSSAAGAGLQPRDVVVSLDGEALAGFEDVRRVIGRHKAGDTLEVRFYRGADLHTVPMTLKPRQLPPMPATAAQLAEQLGAPKRAVHADLAALFEGYTEAEAGHKAAPDRWSAKEVLAHLINVERDNATFVASLATGVELESFTANLDAKLAGTVSRFETVKGLLQALKDAEAETEGMLKALPDSFLARKSSLARVLLAAEFGPSHTRHHFGQIKTALEAARK